MEIMKEYHLNNEAKMKYLKVELENQARYEALLTEQEHFVPALDKFSFVKSGNTIMNSLMLPSMLHGLSQEIKNPNPYQVKAFSINNYSNIPICYVPMQVDGESDLNIEDYRSATRISEIILA